MPVEIIMPKVDMDMATGKILSWLFKEGDRVAKGDPLFEIETDKAAFEVESPADGLLYHTAPEGMEIPIGTPCAWLYAPDEQVGDQPSPFGGADHTAANTEPAEQAHEGAEDIIEDETQPAASAALSASASTFVTADSGKTRATPRARSLAADAGLDLASLTGTGPRSRVQAVDVLEALNTPAPVPTSVAAPFTFRPETGDLSVTRSKDGEGTPVVLIHGFASDATSWAPLERSLRHRPLIRIDLPGHGKSPKLPIDSFADLVKVVRQSFDSLGVESAHLVGHSLGGAISLALADTRSKSLSSLTLIAPSGLGPDINGDALNGICNANRPESLGPWLRSLVANEDIITDSYVRLAMSGRSDPNLRAAQIAMSRALFPDGVQSFDLRAALERIELPTRIIWGKQDAIIPWKHALRAPGHVGLHLFEGIGHMPQIECSNEIGALVRAYV